MRRHLLLMAATATAAVVISRRLRRRRLLRHGGAARPRPPGAGCAPVAGNDLVVLTDDKNLQNTDNVIPAINKKASSPQLIAALDKVSAALDTTKLIALNKAVDIDRKSSKAAAPGVRHDQQPHRRASRRARRQHHGRRGELQRERHARRDLRPGADRGRLHGQGAADRQPRALRAGAGEGRHLRSSRSTRPPWRRSSQGKVDKNGKDPSSSDLNTTVTNLKALGDKVGLVFGQAVAGAGPERVRRHHRVRRQVRREDAVRPGRQVLRRGDRARRAGRVPAAAEVPGRASCQVYNFQAGKFATPGRGRPADQDRAQDGHGQRGPGLQLGRRTGRRADLFHPRLTVCGTSAGFPPLEPGASPVSILASSR